jgi:protocatechuate 3,4-dioxygenase beta subunit
LTGKPVAGIPVTASTPEASNFVGDTTGTDGTYSFHILPGTYDMRLNYHELWNDQTLLRHFEIVNNQTQTFDYQIDAPMVVHGIVLGPDGKPVAGAILFPGYMQQNGGDIKTDAQGKFVIDGPGLTRNSTLVARVHLASGDLATESPYVFTGTDNVVLHLEPGVLSTLTGLVKDKDGAPIPNAKVELYRNLGSYGTGVGSTTTDASGRYSFPSNFGNSSYQVQVASSGYVTGWSANTNVPAGKTFNMPDVVVAAASGFVGGTLLDVSGKPVAGATISDNQREDVKTTTDADGHFLLKGMNTGQVVLTIQTADGRSDYPQMPGGRSDYTLYMPSPVSGTVLGPDGVPVAGAKVTANVSQYAAETFITDSTGQFTIASPGLKPKTQLMAFSGTMSTAAPVVYNGEAQLTLRLSKGGLCIITGKIQDTNGNPIANASVKLIRQGSQVSGELESALTDGQGKYTFSPIYGNSKYRVMTSPQGYGSGNSEQFDAAADQTVQAPTLKLGIADAFVGGTVVDAKGTPVAGVGVTDQDITSISGTTDQSGHFMLKNVPRGKTNVFAMAQDGSIADADLVTGRGDNIMYLKKQPEQK